MCLKVSRDENDTCDDCLQTKTNSSQLELYHLPSDDCFVAESQPARDNCTKALCGFNGYRIADYVQDSSDLSADDSLRPISMLCMKRASPVYKE